MFSPLLRLVLREPGLLAEHADAYADLARRDLEAWQAHLRRCLLLWALAATWAGVALTLGGVALMLWAVSGNGHWLLWAVPLAPALGALAAAAAAAGGAGSPGLESLREQFHRDMDMFKESL